MAMEKNRDGRGRPRLVWPLATAVTWVASLVWVAGQIGVAGVGAGLTLSVFVTAPIVAVFLWLDRWERERPSLLFSALVWGASVAAFCSIWSQQWLHALVDLTLGTDAGAWIRPLLITPITEEVLKGLFLVWLLVRRRREITSVLDGIVYAGLAGAGFAFTENSLYFGRALTDFASAGTSDVNAVAVLGVTFFLRVVMVPFFHSLMVVLTGIGVGLAATGRGSRVRALPVVLGMLAAVVLHGVWDWAGLASTDPYLIYKIYGAVMVPVFLAVLVLALILRRREGRMVLAGLPILARDGVIAAGELRPLGNLRERRRWRAKVRRDAGRTAARATARYQAAASALAIRVAGEPYGDDARLVSQREAVAVARSAMRDAARRGGEYKTRTEP
jgi:RsiW-degrading membrane proteinase PrsW (M82 family)